MRTGDEIAASKSVYKVLRRGEDGIVLQVVGPRGNPLNVIASWGLGWDHVSVSAGYCPTWADMEHVKRIFFKDDETAVQFHPAVQNYINVHLNCLHLWRMQCGAYQLPPPFMV